MIEVTDEAIKHLLQKQEEERFSHIRLGITGGGCAGFEYIFAVDDIQDDDIVLDYGKWSFIINKISVPYLNGMTLDYVKEGLNNYLLVCNKLVQN